MLLVKRILFLLFSCYSSFTALWYVVGPWSPRCWGFKIIDISRGKDLSARDSSVRIAIRYRLDVTGIESRWGRDTPHLYRQALRHPASNMMSTGTFPEVKRPGRGFDHPNPSGAEVKERVELCLYSLSWPSWSVTG